MAYIILTIKLECPFCSRLSIEELIAETDEFDKEQMARYLRRQAFDCQLCSQSLPAGTWVNAHAELATPEKLRQMHFCRC
jgi:hypothetical protein